jgi:hypothetical protein
MVRPGRSRGRASGVVQVDRIEQSAQVAAGPKPGQIAPRARPAKALGVVGMHDDRPASVEESMGLGDTPPCDKPPRLRFCAQNSGSRSSSSSSCHRPRRSSRARGLSAIAGVPRPGEGKGKQLIRVVRSVRLDSSRGHGRLASRSSPPHRLQTLQRTPPRRQSARKPHRFDRRASPNRCGLACGLEDQLPSHLRSGSIGAIVGGTVRGVARGTSGLANRSHLP